MVRLKATPAYEISQAHEFQFHYGSVKRRSFVLLQQTLNNFNSTMVRLKEFCRSVTNYSRTRFQFHYGSVKRPKVFWKWAPL